MEAASIDVIESIGCGKYRLTWVDRMRGKHALLMIGLRTTHEILVRHLVERQALC